MIGYRKCSVAGLINSKRGKRVVQILFKAILLHELQPKCHYQWKRLRGIGNWELGISCGNQREIPSPPLSRNIVFVKEIRETTEEAREDVRSTWPELHILTPDFKLNSATPSRVQFGFKFFCASLRYLSPPVYCLSLQRHLSTYYFSALSGLK
jgi:hypothetical protein